MEKINKQKSTNSIFGKKKRKVSNQNSNSVEGVKTNIFAQQLESSTSVDTDEIVSVVLSDGSLNMEVLQELQDDIHQKGSDLLKNPRIDYVITYRQSIQKLLKSVIPHLHKKTTKVEHRHIMTENGPSLSKYEFTLITKINNKLDDIVKIVYGSQQDQLQLMNALDEMRGMIVNLLH